MSASISFLDGCAQAWCVEMAVMLCLALGFVLLRSKRGPRAAGPSDPCAALMRAHAARGMLGEARALYEEAAASGAELSEEAEDLYDEVLARGLCQDLGT
mmetsp:Transcript_9572/g.28276  ORF Transcript_9572/g.28276 Transcript_9572/m.28276 type:complete len:100 (+) Transcript_9572:155-454(+)